MKDSAAVSPAETTVQKIAIDEGARNRVSLSDRAVVDRIKQLRDVPFDSTPMLHAPVEQQPPSSVEASVPDFQLQAVMSGSASHAAHVLINGRVCALGETVPGTDWIVAEIHADERSIMLEHQATNRTVTLSLRPLH